MRGSVFSKAVASWSGSVLVIGGARSGKSRFALSVSSSLPGPKFFIATARALDEEMAERIKRHRLDRGTEWTTMEEPSDVAERLAGLPSGSVVVIDCLTLWLTNLMEAGLDDGRILDEAERLANESASERRSVVLVSNEVGLGIVPASPMARRFVDLAGLVNRKFAETSREVYLLAAGLPMKIK